MQAPAPERKPRTLGMLVLGVAAMAGLLLLAVAHSSAGSVGYLSSPSQLVSTLTAASLTGMDENNCVVSGAAGARRQGGLRRASGGGCRQHPPPPCSEFLRQKALRLWHRSGSCRTGSRMVGRLPPPQSAVQLGVGEQRRVHT